MLESETAVRALVAAADRNDEAECRIQITALGIIVLRDLSQIARALESVAASLEKMAATTIECSAIDPKIDISNQR